LKLWFFPVRILIGYSDSHNLKNSPKCTETHIHIKNDWRSMTKQDTKLLWHFVSLFLCLFHKYLWNASCKSGAGIAAMNGTSQVVFFWSLWVFFFFSPLWY
jgi:hypothetical protein